MSISFKQLARAAVAVLTASLIAACGGGGETSGGDASKAVFITNPRALPAEYLGRQAVAYSPFRSNNRDTETITTAMVKEDLDLLVRGNFRLIRLFDSSDKVAKLVLDVIADNNLDMKVQLGAYVNTFKNVDNPYVKEEIKTANGMELARAVALATNPKYKDTILAVSVGNETMVNWSIVPIDPADMAAYIKYVRDRVTQPVTTDDNFLFYSNPIPKVITDQIDFAAIHAYPNIDTEYPDSDFYWDWKQLNVPEGPARAKAMMDASIVELKEQYQSTRVALDSMGLDQMPIVFGETGWKARITGDQRFRAHPVNQKMYFQRLEEWRQQSRLSGAGPANIFYFEAFDEPWKQGDDGWGLFNVNRKARYVVQNLYPQSIWESTTLTDNDAVYFLPPAINTPFADNQYTLFSDAVGAVLASGLRVDAFDGNSVNAPTVNSAQAPEGSSVIQLTPTPKNYGWGLIWGPQTEGTTQNLSAFAGGSLNLWVKGAYPGKIEVGLSTLTTEGESQEVYLQIGNGDYGYCTTDAWCRVTIPMQAFKTKNPKIDFQLVVSPFIIADRYEFTGKALNSNITTPLSLDGVYWTR